ncbi:MAG: REP-associated tyrosine transposase [Solirubrobacterales bacterium]
MAAGLSVVMPRKAREDIEGAIQHVFARGVDRRVIFIDDHDRRMFLDLLREVIIRTEWNCLAYCLMPNHFHLLLETPKASLGSGMQRLSGDYARYVNDRQRRSGHLFQGRYGSVRVKTDEQLLMTAAYIADNPVEAKLCKRPEQWPWSSFCASAPAWLATERLNVLLGSDPHQGGSDPFRLGASE